ncbi:ClpP-like prohead protease/major capsid protein fusion protein [Pasteurella multocida]|uniref:ClpP-like prohead protease/major capsid protein fusion protein n=2 Tax=Pasteurella multocida TaxID=747 RepID=UPI002020AD79|nr:ClpP-like prohead protease/major capsid protein fusion protein [Pasteurella multocida]MCL7774800.1 Clp protease ClpP [Pasteurella multocida]
MKKKTAMALTVAMAAASVQMNNDTQSWFSIKAGANDTAEISIYDEIGGWGISAKAFAKQLKDLGNVKKINLHIHSPGGSVFDGMAIFNLLNNHTAKKIVYIDGLAASMASVIAMVGDVVIMPENAMMMIHKPWGIQGGDAEDMRKYADLLDKIEETLISAYTKKTGKSAEELAEMLAEETWLSGQECVEHGFADQLAEPVKAMAKIKSQRMKEFSNMPEAIKNMLFSPKAQTTEPKTDKTTTQPENNVVDNSTEIKAQAAKRIADIKAVFAPFAGHQDLLIECLSDLNITAEQAKDKLLAKLGANTTPSANGGYVDNGNIVGDSVKNSLLARAGKEEIEKDNAYNGMTLRELARASIADRGVSISGMNAMSIVGLAFTHSSSDFGSILLDVAHKSVLEGWAVATDNFDKFTTKGSVSDFRKHNRVGLTEFGPLPVVSEGEEYTYGTIGDKQVAVAIATYGKLFSITRQAIINDDMSMLTRIPFLMGKSARATVAKLVYNLITSNGKWQDGKVLFSADRKNLLTGSGTKMDVTTIDKAIQLMNGHLDGDKQPLLIEPEFLLAPTSLATKAKQVVGSTSVEGADTNSGIINPINNFAEVIKSQHLQVADAVSWYLINSQAIEVNYLDGADQPYLEQQDGFTVDGVVSKVRIDAGVDVIDPRGIVKVTNQA